jgi:hypothetical protein
MEHKRECQDMDDDSLGLSYRGRNGRLWAFHHLTLCLLCRRWFVFRAGLLHLRSRPSFHMLLAKRPDQTKHRRSVVSLVAADGGSSGEAGAAAAILHWSAATMVFVIGICAGCDRTGKGGGERGQD